MIKSRLFDILTRPLVTEKATSLNGMSKYTYVVPNDATKKEVSEAVSKIFSTEVLKVNVINSKPSKRIFRGIRGVRSGFKKVIVTLKSGKAIELSAGA